VSRNSKIAIAGVIIGLILLVWVPWYITALVVIAALAVPTVGYFMLDPSQRRRLRNIQQRRKQIDR